MARGLSLVKKTIVYGICDPVTEEVRYVGYSSRGYEAPREILTNKRNGSLTTQRLSKWIKEVCPSYISNKRFYDHKMIILLEIVDTKENLLDRRRYWMKQYQGHRLLNYRIKTQS